MRLSTKLLLGLMATGSLVLGLNGLRQYAVEKGELKAVAAHQLRLLSSAVQVAAENALRDGQAEDIHEVLLSLEVWDSDLDVYVYDADGRAVARSPGAEEPLPTLRERTVDTANVFFFDDVEHLVAEVPMFADNGQRLGHVLLIRPLGALRTELNREAISLAVSVGSLLVALGAVGALMILVLVHRPLARMRSAMEAVRQGDLSARLEVSARDELGELSERFNEMVRALAEARRGLAEASEHREALVAGLQRVDKLAAVGQLSAGLAHEIGSPLQILGGRAQAIVDRKELPAEVRRHGQILVEQTARITRIVEQLMGFARRRQRSVEAVDLGATVTTVVELVGTEARRRHIGIEFTIQEGLPPICADEGQLQQVILNLLTNAIRASSTGGRIWVALGSAHFQPAGGGPEVEAQRLTVRDEGRGIPPEQLDSLFEPFFVGDSAGDGALPGTGLGLAVVQTIVRDHAGHIEVRSAPGAGSTFSVWFRSATGPKQEGVRS